jgi:hypothetical protein
MEKENVVLYVKRNLLGGGGEETVRCLTVEEAQGVRREYFATREDIAFALIMEEPEYQAFREQIKR